jgi:excisionase family DNA binding protein
VNARSADIAAPKFYDVQEVAEMLRVSRMTIYRAISAGELRAVRIRGRLLIPARVIEALVSSAAGEDGAP